MKKFQKFLVATFAVLLMNIANALEIVDVRSDYWAGQEIVRAIQNGYIYVIDGNKFKPEDTMTRSEFVTALLKVIQRQDEAITQRTTFKDIDNLTPNKRNIILSEQIRMAFGYPDKTFKPNLAINHNETMSMIANITNGNYVASDITGFKDYNKIPLWAKRAWIKNVANGLYVNHPDLLSFTPANDLTRAEAAVLFDKIANNLDKVKEQYRDLYNSAMAEDEDDNGLDFDKSVFIAENTLDLAPFATNNKVQVYDNKKIIEAGNILIGTALDVVETRKDLVGHEYRFTAPNDVYSTQGTFLYPKGTEFYARVDKIGYSAWRSKPETSTVVFHKYSLPTGETYDMAGVPFTKNDKVIYVNDVKNVKKAKDLANYKMSQKEYLIAVAHQMSPLMEFNIKTGKTIYILLTGDMVIPQNENYLQLRTKKSLLEQDDNDI
ncbi:MAG: S-layer homology domain-containing protein [Candidatus Gastranaerophilales bacterium]|nr:S-layer homology domain-containing protein [Candidatus Gastranaerophilales bacterium]